MPREELRFGIAAVGGYRAATWKLWTDGGGERLDLYLACRPLGGHLKTSLHASGKWHTAYTHETFESAVKDVVPEGRDRFVERWPRPSPLAPGIVLAFRIVTPSAAVTSPISPADPEVTWLPNAPDGKATEIAILLVEPPVTVPGWPGRLSMGTSLVGSLQLGAGETAWVVIGLSISPRRRPCRRVRGGSTRDAAQMIFGAPICELSLSGRRSTDPESSTISRWRRASEQGDEADEA